MIACKMAASAAAIQPGLRASIRSITFGGATTRDKTQKGGAGP